jgi:outer membrane murein-binding lipoprotein Lpp
MSKDDNYTAILLEDMNDKFDLIMEAIRPLQTLPAQVARLGEDVAELKSDMKVVKAAITDLTPQVNDIDVRVQRLESKI